jgi:hypothetical protein
MVSLMSDQAPRWPGETLDAPSTAALTIDVDVHHALLAVLISAVDRLPGGSGAITAALADLEQGAELISPLAEDPDPSGPMARQFIAALEADRNDRATRAAQDRPTTITSREEDAHVE